ncbi:MAG: right-handed parallel beta-helix repeat-containing protein [Candidatus Kariarchaeaceae archaeon]
MQKLNSKYSLILLLLLVWFTKASQVNGTTDSISLTDITPMIPDRLTYYMIPHDPISITNDSELATLASSGTGIFGDPYIIENLYINTDLSHGIYITNTTKEFIIRNCFIDTGRVEGHYGIFLYDVAAHTATLQNNTCQYSIKGIYVKSSPETSIESNYCYWPYWSDYHDTSGIEIYRSHNSVIYNNTCLLNRYGIKVILSDMIIIQNNQCNYNYGPGIMVQGSYNALIFNNVFSNNDDYYYSCAYCPSSLLYGIFLSNTSSSNIMDNELISNGFYGVFIDTISSGNQIYSNRFIDNYVQWESYCLYVGCDGESYSQANDDGSDNLWFSTSDELGNYWSEFSDDDYYAINGIAGSYDEVPLNYNLEPISPDPTTYPTDVTADPTDAPMADDAAVFSFYAIIFSTTLIMVVIFSKRKLK